MADTVAVMNGGRIEQLGSPIDVYEGPRTAFVANFLGQANLYPGTTAGAAAEAMGTAVTIADATVTVPASALGGRSGRVVVGVRPEKIRVVDPGAVDSLPANRMHGTIAEVAFVGVSTQYVIALPSGGRLAAFEQNLDPREVGRPGEPVALGWEPRHTFILDADEDLRAGLLDTAIAPPMDPVAEQLSGSAPPAR